MLLCPACQNEIPSDSRFCGFCGFRMAPIPAEEHHSLSKELGRASAGQEPEAVPLTRPKSKAGPPAPDPSRSKPQLVVVEGDPALDDTMPRVSDPGPAPQGDVLEDTAPAASAPEPAAPEPQAEPREQRRSTKRFPLKVEVNYGSEHNFYTGFMENVSSGGLFVATHDPVSIGDLFEVTFTVPGLRRSCTAACEVRWVREFNPLAPDTVPGMGLKFVELDPEAKAAVELFIRHREPIFFDDEL